MKKQTKDHKAIIETIINTSALALTAFGVQQITSNNLNGYIALLMGIGLEYFKYIGRSKNLW